MDADSVPLRVQVYVDACGGVPFESWKRGLVDGDRVRVEIRIERLRLGNWGDWRSIGDGVVELRIHHGPGYRIYVGRKSVQTVILLGGGRKSTQQKDIERVQARWADFHRRFREALG